VYRFALRPRWILSHLFVLALVVTMVNLGFWQLRRLDQRRESNRVVKEHLAEPPVPLDELVGPGTPAAEVDRAANRRVTVTGTYERDDQVLVRSRSLNGDPGSWVLTPLRRPDGSLVVVNRGWIGNDGTFDAVPGSFIPQSGTVHVQGLLQTTQTRGRFGPRDPASGRLTSLARVDVERYAQQLDGPVVPAWVQLRSEAPHPAAGRDVPVVLGLPELDEGPHLSYAIQWFIFSTIAVVGYPLILRRNARERRSEGAERDDEDEEDLEAPVPAHEAGIPADGRR
jgi:cytochrome oxidase assembly protein ShyY1